ncbi:phage tail protein [Yersinia enterocolitica]
MQKIGDIPNTRADNNGEFTDGNVAGGVPPTILPAEWFNTIQRELMSILNAAEIESDPHVFNQVLLSIQKLVSEGIPDLKDASLTQKGIVQLSNATTSNSQILAATPKAVSDLGNLLLKITNNLSEIKDAGPVAVAQTLVNLGLGAGGFPIGMPFFWPSATLPNLLLPEWSNMVFLKFNNSSFSATTYPKLAQIFPSLVLPDARGNFPRIWDDGRGLDPGRVLLSQQGDAIRNFSGYIDAVYGQAAANRGGPFYNNAVSAERYNTTKSSGVDTYMNISFEPGRVVPVANENRPVNIAFNLLVRAA